MGAPTSKSGLTDKQRRFVEEYLVDLNATQAAIRAGFSEKSASEQGYQLLHKTSVARAIAERQIERAERMAVSQDMVVAGLLREAHREGEGSSHAARVQAWQHLGRHLGMFRDGIDHHIQPDETLPEQEAAKRLVFLLNQAVSDKQSKRASHQRGGAEQSIDE